MKPIFESQELAKCFNEDESVWRSFEEKRKSRRRFSPDSVLSEELLEEIDWLESERECRETACVGRACHGLVPLSLTLVATARARVEI